MSLAAMAETIIRVALNGDPIQGLLHASIVTSNCFHSDSFDLTFATGPWPLCDVAFWSSLSSAYIEISVAEESSSVRQNLISGMIDTVLVDQIQGTVSVEGRDLSASLIDGYRQQDFVNQTASEVVAAIAQFHGLTPVVTATFGNVGRYYGDGYTQLSLGQFSRLRSDWDLVVQLARENGFDIFVEGTSLFFQPAASSDATPVRIAVRDVKIMRFEQSLAMTQNASARVQSWNSQNVASYATDDANGGPLADQASSTGDVQPFLFAGTNLTSQQVTDAAGRFAAEVNRLSTVLHIEMPWDLTLSPRTRILVNETASILDTTYQIDHIERHYSTTSGSSQTIRAINA